MPEAGQHSKPMFNRVLEYSLSIIQHRVLEYSSAQVIIQQVLDTSPGTRVLEYSSTRVISQDDPQSSLINCCCYKSAADMQIILAQLFIAQE